ncbi:MAG: hypothetical protein U0T81_14465 [Saprospiraceae bacterium]
MALGVSPFLPSSLIVASNIEDGLFILKPDYQRACYLEGLVTDTITGLRINNVSVKIIAPRHRIWTIQMLLEITKMVMQLEYL